MSVVAFQQRLHGAKYAQSDLKYFPLWIRRYWQSVTEENGRLAVSVESVNAFSGSLRNAGIPAWQRLQAVRAGEEYRGLVLGTGEPSLGEVRQVLQRAAEAERGDTATGAAGDSRPGVEDELHLVGIIDPHEPPCLQEMRRELRVRRKALETERAYAGWVGRFIKHCGSDDLRQFGEREIKSFLTQVTVEGNVGPKDSFGATHQLAPHQLARRPHLGINLRTALEGRARSWPLLRAAPVDRDCGPGGWPK